MTGKNDKQDGFEDPDLEKIDPSISQVEKTYTNFDVNDYLELNQNPANENF